MGRVDLTYNRQADKIDDIKKFLVGLIGDYYEKWFNVVKTGKSCAIRINVPIIFFAKPFDQQEDCVRQALQAVEKLYEISIKLEIAGIYKIYE